MRMTTIIFGAIASVAALGQSGGRLPVSPEDPAIDYFNGDFHDPVAELNRKLLSGAERLSFDETFGYLPALLNALGIPKQSQLLVFSKTSLQSTLISPGNPRAIFFNDSAAVAWVRGSSLLEVAAQDPRQGTIFYTLDQSKQTRPTLAREVLCLGCHQTASSLGVPGMIVRTVFPSETGAPVSGLIGSETDHGTPFEERWGGWCLTGKRGPLQHRANAVVSHIQETGTPAATANREPLPEKFSTTGYLTPYSDIVAMLMFEHQTHMTNLITRMGWEARWVLSRDPGGRTAPTRAILRQAAEELVDYLLFVDEAPLANPISGTSGFSGAFALQGPIDSKGRSLRQLDLNGRLMRHPCSYMIYSEAFQALPTEAKGAVYDRMWEILSGHEKHKKYNRLTDDDKSAVIDILRDTVSFSGFPF